MDAAGIGPSTCAPQFQTLPNSLGNVLGTGQAIGLNQALFSPSGNFFAVLQPDGNFVEYQESGLGRTAVWSTATAGRGSSSVVLQSDGNLVLYPASGPAVWSSSTALSSHDSLQMQDDGNLVVYSSIGVPLWSRAGGRTGYSGDQFPAGLQMNMGQYLYSPSGTYEAVMQGDGNFVVYRVGGASVWSTQTGGKGGTHIAMQGDGNLVVYTAGGTAVWSSSTAPSLGDSAVMQDDSNLVIFSGSGPAIWSSNGGHVGGGPNPGPAIDDYPAQWRNIPMDSVFDTWREYNRECTSFVAFRLSSRNGYTMPFYDNASGWGSDFQARGMAPNNQPAVGSIAWKAGGDHVAWVRAVGNGTVTIEEYNEYYNGTYSIRTVPSSTFQYIHPKDL